jgi:hypothetical protein
VFVSLFQVLLFQGVNGISVGVADGQEDECISVWLDGQDEGISAWLGEDEGISVWLDVTATAKDKAMMNFMVTVLQRKVVSSTGQMNNLCSTAWACPK